MKDNVAITTESASMSFKTTTMLRSVRIISAVLVLTVLASNNSAYSLFPSLKPAPHIVGGDEAVPHAYPYHVGLKILKTTTTKFCGGSLLSNQWVVTAAHCLNEVVKITVILGAHHIYEDQQTVQKLSVQDIYIHPLFNSDTKANDIALLKLNETAKLTEKTVETIRLPALSQKSELFVDAAIVLTGWGRDSDLKPNMSPVLRSVTTRVSRNLFCIATFFPLNITDTQICSSGYNKKGPCHGDSGGPMVTTEKDGIRTLIGVISMVAFEGCEIDFPSVSTRVTSFLDWIHATTGIPPRP